MTDVISSQLLQVLVLFGFAFIPAAFGAASGYGSPTGPGLERRTSAAAGAFFFTGVAMAGGLCLVLVMLLGGTFTGHSSGHGLMGGIAVIVFLAVYGFIGSIWWLLTCYLAKLGAWLGARGSHFTCALFSGTFAGCATVGVPAMLGWFS